MSQIWDKVHAEREWGAYPNEMLVRWAFKELKPLGDVKVLDLGCGQGASTWFLAREGFKVTAIDFSPNAVKKCKKRLKADKLKASFVVGNIVDLPFKDQYFDAVVDIISSAHNTKKDIEKIYKEVGRVLKPGGKLFLITPKDESSKEPFEGYGPIRFMSYVELDWMLKRNYKNIRILRASYGITETCEVDNWVVAAEHSTEGES